MQEQEPENQETLKQILIEDYQRDKKRDVPRFLKSHNFSSVNQQNFSQRSRVMPAPARQQRHQELN